MSKILLVTRPEHDTPTYYLCLWSKEIIDEAEKESVEVIDLRREKASKKSLESYSSSKNPDIFFFNGHGDEKCIKGHENESILEKDENEELTKGSSVYTRACEAASKLGPSCVKNGAKAFIGYVKPFIFYTSKRKQTKPLQDRVASLPLKCSNEIVKSLVRGISPRESQKRSKDMHREKISEVLTDPNYSLEKFQSSSRDSWDNFNNNTSLLRNYKIEIIIYYSI